MEDPKHNYVMKLIVKSEDCIYVKCMSLGTYTNVVRLDGRYLIDGKPAEGTCTDCWYKIGAIPKSFQIKGSDTIVNRRYGLRNGIPPSELLPKEILPEDGSLPEEYERVSGCYDLKYETIPGTWEELDFTTEIIYKSNDFEWFKTEYPHNHFLIDQIECPSEMLDSLRPCVVDKNQMYSIIRSHIKKNIDPTVATITSDYDFVFRVSRDVKLAVPLTFSSDIGTKRKPKWIETKQATKRIDIYEITTEASYLKGICKYPEPVIGKNAKDLEEKINQVLEEIMKEINKKYCECPTCQGWGYVEEK